MKAQQHAKQLDSQFLMKLNALHCLRHLVLSQNLSYHWLYESENNEKFVFVIFAIFELYDCTAATACMYHYSKAAATSLKLLFN